MASDIHIVPRLTSTPRLSDYAHIAFPVLGSRKAGKKAVKSGAILVNGETGTTGILLKEGDILKKCESDVALLKVLPLKLTVIYEDDYLAVINKAGDIIVSGNYDRTVERTLPYNIEKSKKTDALSWPKPVHRLDKATSGLLIIAKTKQAQIVLNRNLENRTIKKTYTALVTGSLPKNGFFDEQIEGREAITRFITKKSSRSLRYGVLSFLELFPETGRTHQIRIHLAGNGNSIVGDRIYSEEGKVLKGKGLFLSATGLDFVHPVIQDQSINLKIPPPKKMLRYMNYEEKRWNWSNRK